MKWFRMWTELIDDPKICNMDEKTFQIFILLMCLAAEREKNGSIDLCEKDVAWRLRISTNILTRTRQKLEALSILSNDNGYMRFINWEKRQFRSDCSTERVKRFRNVTRNNIETASETETEIDKTLMSSDETEDRCPHQTIIDLYHKICPSLPRVKIWTSQRQSILRSRWKENKERQNVKFWESFFTIVSESDFLMGRVNHFSADLEWLLRPRNFPKVLEGKYKNKIGDQFNCSRPIN